METGKPEGRSGGRMDGACVCLTVYLGDSKHMQRRRNLVNLSRFLKSNVNSEQLLFIECLLPVKSCVMGGEERF